MGNIDLKNAGTLGNADLMARSDNNESPPTPKDTIDISTIKVGNDSYAIFTKEFGDIKWPKAEKGVKLFKKEWKDQIEYYAIDNRTALDGADGRIDDIITFEGFKTTLGYTDDGEARKDFNNLSVNMQRADNIVNKVYNDFMNEGETTQPVEVDGSFVSESTTGDTVIPAGLYQATSIKNAFIIYTPDEEETIPEPDKGEIDISELKSGNADYEKLSAYILTLDENDPFRKEYEKQIKYYVEGEIRTILDNNGDDKITFGEAKKAGLSKKDFDELSVNIQMFRRVQQGYNGKKILTHLPLKGIFVGVTDAATSSPSSAVAVTTKPTSTSAPTSLTTSNPTSDKVEVGEVAEITQPVAQESSSFSYVPWVIGAFVTGIAVVLGVKLKNAKKMGQDAEQDYKDGINLEKPETNLSPRAKRVRAAVVDSNQKAVAKAQEELKKLGEDVETLEAKKKRLEQETSTAETTLRNKQGDTRAEQAALDSLTGQLKEAADQLSKTIEQKEKAQQDLALLSKTPSAQPIEKMEGLPAAPSTPPPSNTPAPMEAKPANASPANTPTEALEAVPPVPPPFPDHLLESKPAVVAKAPEAKPEVRTPAAKPVIPKAEQLKNIQASADANKSAAKPALALPAALQKPENKSSSAAPALAKKPLGLTIPAEKPSQVASPNAPTQAVPAIPTKAPNLNDLWTPEQMRTAVSRQELLSIIGDSNGDSVKLSMRAVALGLPEGNVSFADFMMAMDKIEAGLALDVSVALLEDAKPVLIKSAALIMLIRASDIRREGFAQVVDRDYISELRFQAIGLVDKSQSNGSKATSPKTEDKAKESKPVENKGVK